MKISKKVAEGMFIGGLVGSLSSVGVSMYFSSQVNQVHPRLEQVLTEIKESFNACYDKRDEASCQKWRQQCANLETELASLGNTQSYQQFLVNREGNQRNYNYTLGVIGLSMVLMCVSLAAVWPGRRENESS